LNIGGQYGKSIGGDEIIEEGGENEY